MSSFDGKQGRITRDEVLPYLYVYKIIFPNGKIYVGADWGRNAATDVVSYFGSFKKSATLILKEHEEHIKSKSFIITKEILYEAFNQTPEHIWAKEREFITMLDAKNPSVGYNKK